MSKRSDKQIETPAPEAKPKLTLDNTKLFKCIDKIVLEDGIELLNKAGRKALKKNGHDAEAKVPAYALLALLTSWQSMQHQLKLLAEENGSTLKDEMYKLSVKGIKEKIEDDKLNRAAAKAANKAGKKGKQI